MTYLWSNTGKGLRTSDRESGPTCRVGKQLLQKSIVLIVDLVIKYHLMLDFFFCVYMLFKLELLTQGGISHICPSIVILE